MANNYYDGTGALVFKGQPLITPIIETLFSCVGMREDTDLVNARYVAVVAEDTNTSWDAVLESIQVNAERIGLSLAEDEDEDDLQTWLYALGEKYCPSDIDFDVYVENLDTDNNFDLADLFDLALWFNDGHNLQAIHFEGAWRSDRPRLFEFGGNGFVVSRNISHFASSLQAREFGERIDDAIESQAHVSLVNHMVDEITRLLGCIKDEALHRTVTFEVCKALRAQALVQVPAAQVGGQTDDQVSADEFFPGASGEEVGSVMMQDVVGEYDVPADVPEWTWVEQVASFSHTRNGQDGVWEFVLNLANEHCQVNIPARFQSVMAEAQAKNIHYLIVHQGT